MSLYVENFTKNQFVSNLYRLQEKYHIYHGDFRFCRYVFNISNRFISYVALVDKDAKVRWTAHGAAADSEIAYLKDAVTELINDGTQTGKQEKV